MRLQKLHTTKAQSAEDTALDAMDGMIAQGETIDATAGAVTGLQSTVADQGATIDEHTAQLGQQQSTIDSQGAAIGTQAENLSALSTSLDLTRQSLEIVHTTADNINNYFSFADGLTIGKAGQDTLSRYESDGMSIIHKNTVAASFKDGGTTTPELTVDAQDTADRFSEMQVAVDGLTARITNGDDTTLVRAKEDGVYVGKASSIMQSRVSPGSFDVLQGSMMVASLGNMRQQLGSLIIYETSDGGHAFIRARDDT